jgi:hypothetical protein
MAKVDEILSETALHVRWVRAKLARAKRQEQTVAGRAERTAGRLLNRVTDKFSNSRIGKEVPMRFKTMVLGTRMFYDMMEMDSQTGMMRWAEKYEADMNQLMEEAEKVSHMDGWSLTGKNTCFEDWTNKAYEESFLE